MRPQTSATSDPAADLDGLVDAIVQTAFVTMAVLGRIAAEHDLSLTQLRVCAILRDRRPRMTVLAAYLGLEKSSLSGLVDRAEQRGLLQRAPNPSDGRAVDVFLTPAGAELAERLHREVAAAMSPWTIGLSTAQQVRLRGLLERLLRTGAP